MLLGVITFLPDGLKGQINNLVPQLRVYLFSSDSFPYVEQKQINQNTFLHHRESLPPGSAVLPLQQYLS